MDEPRDSTSDSCYSCDVYMARIKELEELNDLHRKLNGELREAIAWISMNMNKPMEKE